MEDIVTLEGRRYIAIDEIPKYLNVGLMVINVPTTTNCHKLEDLLFFTAFNTIEKQVALRTLILEFHHFIDENIGYNWLPLYIAYTFALGKRYLFKDYVNFFKDIETLFPDLLTNINTQKKPGYERYEKLIKSLTEECNKWYVLNGSYLPPASEWTSQKYTYQVKDDRRNEVVIQTIPILNSLKSIIRVPYNHW